MQTLSVNLKEIFSFKDYCKRKQPSAVHCIPVPVQGETFSRNFSKQVVDITYEFIFVHLFVWCHNETSEIKERFCND
jgi:hypothetical protein